MTPYEMVKEFMDKHGQYRRTDPGQIPLVQVLLRLRLMAEELGELAEAIISGNRLQIADAVGDLAYVVVGTFVAYGIHDGTIDPKYNPETLPLADIVPTLTYSLGQTAVCMHQFATGPGLEYGIIDCQLTDLYMCVREAAVSLGLPFFAVFTEIHNSNMTKTSPTQLGEGQKLGDFGKGANYRPPNLQQVLETHNLDTELPPNPVDPTLYN